MALKGHPVTMGLRSLREQQDDSDTSCSFDFFDSMAKAFFPPKADGMMSGCRDVAGWHS